MTSTHAIQSGARHMSTTIRAGSRRLVTSAWQLGATTIVWVSCLVVAMLWVGGGGVQSLLGLDAESLASLSRITGLVSANLLLLQVLMMARVPVFERGFGRSGITRMHRLTGIWSFSLLLAHIGLVALAYALQDGVTVIAEAWDLLWNYPGVFFAGIGVALLVLVMATSARSARRRLRYESWHLLHLYAYLGVGLAVPHMLLTGNDFVSNPISAGYWWALWAVAAGCVLIFRVALPYYRSHRHALRVVDVVAEGTRGVTVRMRGRHLDRLGAQAGQHFVWRFLDGPGWSRGHPFSLSAAPVSDGMQISARIVGDGTERLARLRPGTRVLLEGPYGHLTAAARSAPGLLMLAAGAGVAPLVAILEETSFEAGEAVLVTRERTADELMLRETIGRLVSERGLVHYALDGRRAAHGPAWLPAQYSEWQGTEMLQHLAPELAHTGRALLNCDVYLCGPAQWVAAVRADLLRAGVHRSRIHSEFFTTERAEGARS